jgi:hypothetical protein
MGYPGDIVHYAVSRGRCEDCGVVKDCRDCHCTLLPSPWEVDDGK